MKNVILRTAIVAAISAATLGAAGNASASADQKHGYWHRPNVYIAPAPVYVAPRGHYYHSGHQYRHGRWHNGRWIAPVAIAATIGGIALATAPHYYTPPVSYVAPRYYNNAVYVAPTYDHSPTYYNAPAYDAFSSTDRNGDGYISYDEARANGQWQRDFGRIDWNRDGYLSRDEVGAFYR
ncbi:MAG: hypothetical protein EAZ30_16235 [Betaproteobacteria bacterium]|nr:MAG: hypothetical protein EAZ30_16235 [Betaproteobacteria bacterium]